MQRCCGRGVDVLKWGIPAEGRRMRGDEASHFTRVAGAILPSDARLGVKNACACRGGVLGA